MDPWLLSRTCLSYRADCAVSTVSTLREAELVKHQQCSEEPSRSSYDPLALLPCVARLPHGSLERLLRYPGRISSQGAANPDENDAQVSLARTTK